MYTSDYLFLCTGGLTAPKTGTDGSGYTLAQRLGHTLIDPVPAIVQLKLSVSEGAVRRQIRGAGPYRRGRRMHPQRIWGNFVYGLRASGPPILQLSRKAAYELKKGETVTLSLELMPDRTEEEVVDFLDTDWGMFGHRTVAASFIGILNKKLIPVLLKEAGIDQEPNLLCQDLSWKTKKILYRLMKQWDFTVTDTNGFNNAQTTAGGIDTTELKAGTLESKLVPGLFLCGEVMDVDGDCGGYNLQWAWSSGYAAAMALADQMIGAT